MLSDDKNISCERAAMDEAAQELTMSDGSPPTSAPPDMNKFRLRSFVEHLIELGEVEVHDEPVPLSNIARHLDCNPKAVLFRKAGPEQVELVGGVLGSRRRVAEAFGVDEGQISAEMSRRLTKPVSPVEVKSSDAPVHEIVLTGEQADLTQLPAHVQHSCDGAPYISAGIDFTVDPETGLVNVGYRRLMLRGRREAGFNLYAPTDLKEIYRKCAARGGQLPVSFVIGSHPVDCMAAVQRLSGDEIALMGALRQEPVPLVRCITNDIRVPADAEMIIEGYVDERGYRELEGPYGEFMGYYGGMRPNPTFHVTAITKRRDALFQTITISGRRLGLTDNATMCAIESEATIWNTLKTAIREAVGVHVIAAGNGMHHVRVSIRQRVPGEARNVIAAVFGSVANAKHVFVVDEDVDIYSDEQMEWALSTRFQADRDMIIASNFRAIPLDPSLDGPTGAKAGFDLTVPFGKRTSRAWETPLPPVIDQVGRFDSVRAALESQPMMFTQIMNALGTQDGREIVLALDELRQAGVLARLSEGEYSLNKAAT
jgi:2,5-furandicarboxylate decarboxylase 1